MDRPGTGAVRNHGVAVSEGRIIAVGDAGHLARIHPQAFVEDLGAMILLPGLVNPHTHLELSDVHAGDPPAGGFSSWLLALVRRGAVGESQMTSLVEAAVAEGVKQCLRFGVTSVGDISRQAAATRPLLRGGPLRTTSYGEIQALAGRRALFDKRLAAAADQRSASDQLRIGLTPHAPYSVEPQGYLACLAAARRGHLPLATHLAESADEVSFLAFHTGPFRELWEAIGQWDDHVPSFDGGPIRFAKSLGLLDYPTLLAHVNYCSDDEIELLAGGSASVVYCPRTHRYFGHPPHRFREMLERGINVAIGTDSCASSPDLNLVDDLRLVHQIAPEMPAEEVWQMATIRGAKAIDADSRVGSMRPGNFADFTAFAVKTDDPLKEVLESALIPSRTWIGGEPRYSSGATVNQPQ